MRHLPLRARSARRIPSLRQEREQSVKAARAADLPRPHGLAVEEQAPRPPEPAAPAGRREEVHAGGKGLLNWRSWIPRLWAALRPFPWRPRRWWE